MKRLASAILAVAVMTAGPVPAQEKFSLSIGTGGTGGVYYPLGGGLANMLSKAVPGMQVTAEVTGGSVDNLKLIAGGKPYIAFSMADAGQDAYRGEDKFKGNKVPLRTLAVLYPNRMHVVTVEGTGINRLADFKGKRVSTGSPGRTRVATCGASALAWPRRATRSRTGKSTRSSGSAGCRLRLSPILPTRLA